MCDQDFFDRNALLRCSRFQALKIAAGIGKGAALATRRAMANKAADNLLAFFAGQALPSPVNLPARSKN